MESSVAVTPRLRLYPESGRSGPSFNSFNYKVMSAVKFDSENKIWSGGDPTSPIFHENCSIGRAILHLLSLSPDKICQVSADDGSKRTNGEIYQATLKIAFNLRKIGCSKGDIVGFVCRNSHDLTPAFLAALFLGTPTNVLDVSFSDDEIIHIFRMTRPKFVFCDDDVAERVERLLRQKLDIVAKIVILGRRLPSFSHIDDLLNGDVSQTELMKLIMHYPQIERTCIAMITCSSGTTGLPKAVPVTHENLQQRFFIPFLTHHAKPDDSVFCFFSLYWVSGYATLLMSLTLGVKRIITTMSFSPEKLVAIVNEYEISYLIMPTGSTAELVNWRFLTKHSLSNVKGFAIVGSILSEELFNKVRPIVSNGILCNSYGATETGGIANNLNMDKTNFRSVGELIPGVKVKILDEDGKQLGIKQVGEICTKSPGQFKEFYNNSEATKEIIDEDGWVRTGDIGYFDEKGFLYISGRKKNWFKYFSHRIIPEEIEQILEDHPAVFKAVVVGIPDPFAIELPAAVVVLKTGHSVTEEELTNFVEQNTKLLSTEVIYLESGEWGEYFTASRP
ncbi:luciferin 4-monooxygenase-like [Phlebotomus papatasi]|uniref:luciferin 4-monooxygenase-like n=1 Tax=Phlebotomus papatasi TaxID=29031 RepID=UPI0024845312|nr:luciferin 4-monooxygenase-like [Phlebotomus papatasi]